MVMQIERGQNTHRKWERMKIPLLPNNVGKKSVNNKEPMTTVTTQLSQKCIFFKFSTIKLTFREFHFFICFAFLTLLVRRSRNKNGLGHFQAVNFIKKKIIKKVMTYSYPQVIHVKTLIQSFIQNVRDLLYLYKLTLYNTVDVTYTT